MPIQREDMVKDPYGLVPTKYVQLDIDPDENAEEVWLVRRIKDGWLVGRKVDATYDQAALWAAAQGYTVVE